MRFMLQVKELSFYNIFSLKYVQFNLVHHTLHEVVLVEMNYDECAIWRIY